MPTHLLTPDDTPTKIVFDWNSPQVAFELQFIGPHNIHNEKATLDVIMSN